MHPNRLLSILTLSAAAIIGLAFTIPFHARAQQSTVPQSVPTSSEQVVHHNVPASTDGGTVIMLCDGKTSIEVKGLKAGEPMSHAQAIAVTHELMDKWRRENPGEKWEMAQENQPESAASAAANAPVSAAHSAKSPPPTRKIQQGDTYASFTDRDYKIWQTETDKFVAEGKTIFHSSKLLGSTIGVSCDMCHPDAANTHPETYPKYQVQLQRVALLRDMIDWCIENPVKGKTLSPDDEKLRALEAYILAQRKGVPLDYGKH